MGGIIPHELKMDQPPKLPRILMVLSYACATLCAVAASKSDLSEEPYDVIIRLSLEKPACIRCTYWRRPARHYSKAGNDARASQQAMSAPDFRRAAQAPDTRMHPRIIDPLVNDSVHFEFFSTKSAEEVPAQIRDD